MNDERKLETIKTRGRRRAWQTAKPRPSFLRDVLP
jgi:hypothetical protein